MKYKYLLILPQFHFPLSTLNSQKTPLFPKGFLQQHSNRVPSFNPRIKQPFLLRQVSLPRNRPNTSQNALKVKRNLRILTLLFSTKVSSRYRDTVRLTHKTHSSLCHFDFETARANRMSQNLVLNQPRSDASGRRFATPDTSSNE